jgi:hypothetical protein
MSKYLSFFILTLSSSISHALPNDDYFVTHGSLMADSVCDSPEYFEMTKQTLLDNCSKLTNANLQSLTAEKFCFSLTGSDAMFECQFTLLQLTKQSISVNLKGLDPIDKSRLEGLLQKTESLANELCTFTQEKFESKPMWSAIQSAEERLTCSRFLYEQIQRAIFVASF